MYLYSLAANATTAYACSCLSGYGGSPGLMSSSPPLVGIDRDSSLWPFTITAAAQFSYDLLLC